LGNLLTNTKCNTSFAYRVQPSTLPMCTKRNVVFTHFRCTPVLIIKCPAQEFVEEQAIKYNRKSPLAYKYCVNYMVANDRSVGRCRGRQRGYVMPSYKGLQLRGPARRIARCLSRVRHIGTTCLIVCWEDTLGGLRRVHHGTREELQCLHAARSLSVWRRRTHFSR
jgi:hypothetical protein